MNVTKKIGLLLTGIWLILMGLPAFITFLGSKEIGYVIALLGIVAGVFVILDR